MLHIALLVYTQQKSEPRSGGFFCIIGQRGLALAPERDASGLGCVTPETSLNEQNYRHKIDDSSVLQNEMPRVSPPRLRSNPSTSGYDTLGQGLVATRKAVGARRDGRPPDYRDGHPLNTITRRSRKKTLLRWGLKYI